MMNRREFAGHLVSGGVVVAASAAGVASIGCAVPGWLDTAIADLPSVLNIVTTIAGIVAGAGGSAAVAAAASAISLAIPIIQALIKDYQTAPSASIIEKIRGALVDVQLQLSSIMDAAHILNGALRAVIATSIGLAIGVITTILSLLPVPHVAAAAKNAQRAAQSGWASNPTNVNAINLQFHAFLVADGYGNAK